MPKTTRMSNNILRVLVVYRGVALTIISHHRLLYLVNKSILTTIRLMKTTSHLSEQQQRLSQLSMTTMMMKNTSQRNVKWSIPTKILTKSSLQPQQSKLTAMLMVTTIMMTVMKTVKRMMTSTKTIPKTNMVKTTMVMTKT